MPGNRGGCACIDDELGLGKAEPAKTIPLQNFKPCFLQTRYARLIIGDVCESFSATLHSSLKHRQGAKHTSKPKRGTSEAHKPHYNDV